MKKTVTAMLIALVSSATVASASTTLTVAHTTAMNDLPRVVLNAISVKSDYSAEKNDASADVQKRDRMPQTDD